MTTHSGAWIDDRWALNGLQTLIMENSEVRAVVLPGLGAKLHEFTDKESDRDFLYHHPRIEPAPPVFGEPQHSIWTGGLEELIPTGWESRHKGTTYPSLGEVWCQGWQHDVLSRNGEEVSVHLWCGGVLSPMRVDRWVTLRADEKMLRLRHRITNLDDEVFDFLWCLHPAFDTTPDCRIDLPAGEVLLEHYGPAFFEQEADSYTWPHYHREDVEIDMRFWLPSGTPKVQLHYAFLDEGWLAFTDQASQQGIGMAFPVDVLPMVGLWLLYGWRGLYAVTLAPWNGYPVRLHEAAEKGICSHLPAGESLECETRVVLYSGLTEVSSIDMEGNVAGASNP